MSCGMELIKFLLFIFNFIFAQWFSIVSSSSVKYDESYSSTVTSPKKTDDESHSSNLCGLGILVVGVLIHIEANSYHAALPEGINFPAIALIVIGSIIFIIAFFGCCGAIRESHCMTVTFASFLLTLLIVQIAIAIYVFVVYKESNVDVKNLYTKIFQHYWSSENERDAINLIQSNLDCCGVDSYNDFSKYNMNGTLPLSCCDDSARDRSCSADRAYPIGCATALKQVLVKAGKIIGGVALGIASVEFIGIVFSLCLANSIKEMERRHYQV